MREGDRRKEGKKMRGEGRGERGGGRGGGRERRGRGGEGKGHSLLSSFLSSLSILLRLIDIHHFEGTEYK